MAEEKVGAKYVLRAIPDKCYEEAIEAKARGEMIGWSASNFPQEITTTLGIPVVYPESQAAQIAAKRGALPLLEHAEGDLGIRTTYARTLASVWDTQMWENARTASATCRFLISFCAATTSAIA